MNSNTSTKGIVEQATVSEVNAGTATGGTGAVLFISPDAYANSSLASSTQNLATTTTKNQATSTLTTAFIPTKNHLSVDIVASTSVDAFLKMTFNGDSTGGYASRFTINGATATGYDAEKFIPFGDAGYGANNTVYIHMDIFNLSGIFKYGTWTAQTFTQGTPATGSYASGSFEYKSLSQISQMDFYYHVTGSLMATSSNFRVTGY